MSSQSLAEDQELSEQLDVARKQLAAKLVQADGSSGTATLLRRPHALRMEGRLRRIFQRHKRRSQRKSPTFIGRPSRNYRFQSG